MSCKECPHCQKSGVQLEGLSLQSSNYLQPTSEIETPKLRVRGKAREYTQAFETAWKAYCRKEQKFEAFGIWLLRAKDLGSEAALLTSILAAFKWQLPMWTKAGWEYAPYFERYLKRRKWEDEPMPVAAPRALPIAARVGDAQTAAVDRKVAEYRAAAAKAPTIEELAEIAALRRASK